MRRRRGLAILRGLSGSILQRGDFVAMEDVPSGIGCNLQLGSMSAVIGFIYGFRSRKPLLFVKR